MDTPHLLTQTLKSILVTPTLWLLLPIVLNEIVAEAIARQHKPRTFEPAALNLITQSEVEIDPRLFADLKPNAHTEN